MRNKNYRHSGDYSRKQIMAIKAKYGVQGTTKFYGTRCQWCDNNDATFKHLRSVGGGKVSEVRCIRCGRNAGM